MVEVLRAEAASHPSRGAWIEMNATIDKTGKLTSHPSRGAWIEMPPFRPHHGTAPSHPSRGAWIEIVRSWTNGAG